MTAKSKKVRCLVCHEILTYDNDDTSVLVDHLNLEHSGLDVFRFLVHCQVSSPRVNKRGPSRENCSLEAGDIPSECGLKTKTYKTTVETWTPGPNNISCPKCGKEGQPIIKKQKNKMAKSPLGALCMLGCWPFCFLPFLFRKDQFLDLYCCSCKAYLGTFDKRKRCMTRSQNKPSETSIRALNLNMEYQSHNSGGSEEQPNSAPEEQSPVRESQAPHRSPKTNRLEIPPPLYDTRESVLNADSSKQEPCACARTPVPSYAALPYQTRSDMATETKTGILPSYSTVMKNKSKAPDPVDTFIPPQAPPTYDDVPGVYVIPSSRHMERLYALPTFPRPLWRSRSQPAHCPRCDALVLTITRTHDSIATHVAALALCLFGCWPCCLLPYCLNVCKNTYHLCPICKSLLGAYTPW